MRYLLFSICVCQNWMSSRIVYILNWHNLINLLYKFIVRRSHAVGTRHHHTAQGSETGGHPQEHMGANTGEQGQLCLVMYRLFYLRSHLDFLQSL